MRRRPRRVVTSGRAAAARHHDCGRRRPARTRVPRSLSREPVRPHRGQRRSAFARRAARRARRARAAVSDGQSHRPTRMNTGPRETGTSARNLVRRSPKSGPPQRVGPLVGTLVGFPEMNCGKPISGVGPVVSCELERGHTGECVWTDPETGAKRRRTGRRAPRCGTPNPQGGKCTLVPGHPGTHQYF